MQVKDGAATYDVVVDKNKNKVLVSVELSPKRNQTPTQTVGVSDARQILESQGIEAGVLISGQGIHNNLDRRLGLRTLDDLKTNFVFTLGTEVVAVVEEPAVEEVAPEVVEEEVVVKAAPKRRSRAKKKVD
tara:strand:- start:5050 stop:5442 length:393 start_codon:yes stop_codon:yes gene_type:complete